MRLFKTSSTPELIDGPIKYYDLINWWQSAFTEEERARMIAVYQPMGSGIGMGAENSAPENHLTEGDLEWSSADILGFLSTLAGWFNNKHDRLIAKKILDKAASFIPETKSILSVHFLYQALIETYYPDRDNPDALSSAIEACKNQIKIAGAAAKAFRREYPQDQQLPGHKGYEQLAIIFEKQSDYEEAINTCQKAMKQGWSGDWQHRIERCLKRMNNKG